MTELNDNLSCIDSYSISEFSSKDTVVRNELKEDDINIKFYPIRCANCSKIPRFTADFDKNYFCTICELNHKNEYNSFDLFLENSTKDFNNLLCYECQNPIETFSTTFYCEKCNLFLCSKCHKKHIEEVSHLEFISLDKMDNYCSKHDELYKYYDKNRKKSLCEKCLNIENNNGKDVKVNLIEISRFTKIRGNLERNYHKAKENIKMYNNIFKGINEWLQNITNKFNTILNSIRNYCSLQYKIVTYLNLENSYENYKNNYNAYLNYDCINNEKIDKLIKTINYNINNNYYQNDDFSKVTQNIINILELLGQKDINIESKKNVLPKEKNLFPLFSKKHLEELNGTKLEFMDKKEYEINSIIKTFIPFDEQEYLILGLDTGDIQIYEEKEENNENILKKKLEINEFKNEVNNLCEIDLDKIVASDIKGNIKIIQLKDNNTNYSIIQNIQLKEEESNIYTICHLPIFSYYRNRHFFCISNNNKIYIYNSNKRPAKLNPPGLGDNEIQEYSIVQPTFILDDYDLNIIKEYNKKIIEHINEPLSFNSEINLDLNIKFNCILEINEKYCVAASSNSNCIKVFNMQNKFQEVTTITNILCSEGNCILSLSQDRKYLFVATTIGFNIIIINNFNRTRKFQFNHNFLCLNFYKPQIIVTAILKNKELYIRQYIFSNEFKDTQKYSEFQTYSTGIIYNIKVINNKIYYLDGSQFLHYFQEREKEK